MAKKIIIQQLKTKTMYKKRRGYSSRKRSYGKRSRTKRTYYVSRGGIRL